MSRVSQGLDALVSAGLLTFAILLAMPGYKWNDPLVEIYAQTVSQSPVVIAQPSPAQSVDIALLTQGVWNLPIVTAAGADPEVEDAAEALANILEQMAGVRPTEVVGQDLGIRVGRYNDFPDAGADIGLGTADQDHVVVSHANNLYLLGDEGEHVSDAVYEFLEAIGYRQLLPEPLWESVPGYSDLTVNLDIRTTRLFRFPLALSNGGYGGGGYPFANARRKDWQKKNLMYRAEGAGTGHAWQSVVLANKEEFDLNDGIMANKYWLCTKNPRTRELTVEWVKEWLDARAWMNFASVSIPDGSFRVHDPCDNGEHVDSWANRQLTLAEHVYDELQNDPLYQNKGLFIQAYGHTAEPPTVPLDPNKDIGVLVMKGYTQNVAFNAVYQGYKDAGFSLHGPYIYLSVFTGSKNKFGAAKMTRPHAVADEVLSALGWGAQLFSGEWGNAMAPYGPSAWILSRLLRNPDTANIHGQVDEMYTEFINTAFGTGEATYGGGACNDGLDNDTDGNADDADSDCSTTTVVDQMRIFYELVQGEHNAHLLTPDALYRAYDALSQAKSAATSQVVKDRIDYLVLYVRYLELVYNMEIAPDVAKTAAADEIFKHTHKMIENEIEAYHSRMVFYDPTWSDFVDDVLSTYYDYAVGFQETDLVADNAGAFTLQIRSGILDTGKPDTEVSLVDQDTGGILDQTTVIPDNATGTYTLTAPSSGTFTLRIEDHDAGYELEATAGQGVTVSIEKEKLSAYAHPSTYDVSAYSTAEIDQFVTDGLANNAPTAYTPYLSLDTEWVRPQVFASLTSNRLSYGYTRNGQDFQVWVGSPGSFTLDVVSGKITQEKPDTEIRLIDPIDGTVLEEFFVAPDKQTYTYTLTAPRAGAYILNIEDHKAGVLLENWHVDANGDPQDVSLTIDLGSNANAFVGGGYGGYFYVPSWANKITVYVRQEGNLKFFNQDGEVMADKDNVTVRAFHSIPVAPEDRGKVWKFAGAVGELFFLDIPGGTALSASELLIPKSLAVSEGLFLEESCAAILDSNPAATDGEYLIDPEQNGMQTTVWCDMTTAGGGWTLFYAGHSGRDWTADGAVANFDTHIEDCPDTYNKCLRRLPQLVDVNTTILATCGDHALSFPLTQGILDYLKDGISTGWHWIIPTAETPSTNLASVDRFYTAVGGTRGIIIGHPVLANRDKTFSSASTVPTFSYCNGSPSNDDRMSLLYRQGG